MAIKLKNIYEDVRTFLSSSGELYHNDLIKVINDSIRELRREYIINGLSEDFLYTETVYFSIKDFTYPFLYSSQLTYDIIQDVPITLALTQSVVWKTENELEDDTQTWSVGDVAIKDNYLYEATDDITNENTYDLTFDLEKVKNFYSNNGLQFKANDIVLDQATGNYYKCDTDYLNNQGETITESGAFTKVYWKKVGQAFFEGTYLPFTSLYEAKISNSIRNHYPFAVRNKDVFTTVSNVPFTFSYVPEWEDVTDLDEELSIPDDMVRKVKVRSIQLLGQKLGISSELLTQEE